MDAWLDLHTFRTRDLIREARDAKRRKDLSGSEPFDGGDAGGPRPASYQIAQGEVMTSKAGQACTVGQTENGHRARLDEIEAKVRSIRHRLERGDEHVSLLGEVSAAVSAMKELAADILEAHLETCLAQAAGSPGEAARRKVAEVSATIAQLVHH